MPNPVIVPIGGEARDERINCFYFYIKAGFIKNEGWMIFYLIPSHLNYKTKNLALESFGSSVG